MLGSADPRLPFWVAAGFSLANAAYGYFVLPESLAPDKRGPLTWRRSSPMGALALLRSNAQLFGLSGTMFLFHLSHAVFSTVFVLHAGYRFGWGEGMVGLSLAVFGVFSAIVQGALVKPVVNRFGERNALMLGLAMGVVGFLWMGLAPSSLVFWFGMPIMALWGFVGPAAQALMTRHVAADRAGPPARRRHERDGQLPR